MKALIIVDVQNDFIDGSLAVPNAIEIVDRINYFRNDFDLVVFTKDFHPENHSSFITEGGQWPPHCVKNTYGCGLHKDLDTTNSFILTKGEYKDLECYSAFEYERVGGKYIETGLNDLLRGKGVKEVYICGLATEYCVKETVLSSLGFGYDTKVCVDMVRGIEKGASREAFEHMELAGATLHVG